MMKQYFVETAMHVGQCFGFSRDVVDVWLPNRAVLCGDNAERSHRRLFHPSHDLQTVYALLKLPFYTLQEYACILSLGTLR